MAIKKKIKKVEQDPAELKAMVDYYAKEFSEVYFVRDMLADCVIAVETAPAKPQYATVPRATGKRNIFGYQNLFWTTRLRVDRNKHGNPMVGYQSATGNDTRRGSVERGVVPSAKSPSSFVPDSINKPSSPFERAQLETQVRLSQAKNKTEADYEVYTDKEGHIVERFETFEVVRMK
jgi:hypothetical protein